MASRGGNDFQLIIPEKGERVKINLGNILTVSCHLSPAISAVDMEVTWYGKTSFVCTYKNRKMTQGVEYEDRASLFIHDLNKGNVSLRVTDFRESDLGVYMCQVTSRNTTQQIIVNVAEEVSLIFDNQHFFTVECNMGETSNKLSTQSSCPGDSDNQLEDNRMRSKSKELSSQASHHSESNKNKNEMEALSDENFQLVAPSTVHDPDVTSRSDFMIPCYLSPGISALDMEIMWSKDTECVCLYKDRRLIEGVSFKDRAILFTHKLRKGNVSLLLKNFMLSDVGNYHCQVISKYRSKEITVRVRINPGFQPVSQSPIQDGNTQLMPYEDTKRREPSKKLSRHTSHHSQSDEKRHGSVSSSDDIQLVIPQTSQNATVSIGSEFSVPCYLSPETCATAMQINWFKGTDCVYIYKNRHVIEGRVYKDRVSLVTHELERGNVSLHLSNFSVSDIGDYHCQVISRDRTKQITVGVRIKPEVQPVSQSPTFQDLSMQLMLFEIDKIWPKEETDKMDESALMTEMKVNNVQELHKLLIKAYTEKERQLERTQQDLRETRMDLDRFLKLNPHARFWTEMAQILLNSG